MYRNRLGEAGLSKPKGEDWATIFRSWDNGRLDLAPAGERRERPMTSLKRLFSAAPEGTAALYFIQIFGTLEMTNDLATRRKSSSRISMSRKVVR